MVEIEQMIFIVFERLSHSVHVVYNEPNICTSKISCDQNMNGNQK